MRSDKIVLESPALSRIEKDVLYAYEVNETKVGPNKGKDIVQMMFISSEDAGKKRELQRIIISNLKKIKSLGPEFNFQEESGFEDFLDYYRYTYTTSVEPYLNELYLNKGLEISLAAPIGIFKETDEYKIKDLPNEIKFLEMSSRINNGESYFDNVSYRRMINRPMTVYEYIKVELEKKEGDHEIIQEKRTYKNGAVNISYRFNGEREPFSSTLTLPAYLL